MRRETRRREERGARSEERASEESGSESGSEGGKGREGREGSERGSDGGGRERDEPSIWWSKGVKIFQALRGLPRQLTSNDAPTGKETHISSSSSRTKFE